MWTPLPCLPSLSGRSRALPPRSGLQGLLEVLPAPWGCDLPKTLDAMLQLRWPVEVMQRSCRGHMEVTWRFEQSSPKAAAHGPGHRYVPCAQLCHYQHVCGHLLRAMAPVLLEEQDLPTSWPTSLLLWHLKAHLRLLQPFLPPVRLSA